MKNIWIMTCSSESGDHYDACETWDHKPSKDEINRVRQRLDSTEFDPKYDDEDNEFIIVVDGKKYITYIVDYSIKNVVV